MSRSSSASDRWREVVSRQKASGLSVSEYCRRHLIPFSSFFAWKRRLKRRGSAPGFVELHPAESSEAASAPANARDGAVELLLPGGRRLLLHPGFDPGTLRAALTLLEGRP